MYQALYRKYRSQTFTEMVGQPVVQQGLKQAVATGKISHAYLFSGPRGTGKTSAAKIFAKAMNCPNQTDGEPCNHCDICQAITQGSLEDVIEIDAASNNGVDEIRDIRNKSTYAPSVAKYKVYIIDEVHMLSTGAFNALLKTLEEPTANVVFILATTELHKIPATILSRVQRFAFKAITLGDIQNHLKAILDREAVSYEEAALRLIAQAAEGGMRDALSLLDQALSLSQDNQVTLAIAEDITGAISQEALTAYVLAVFRQETAQALSQLDTIFDSGKSMSRFAVELLSYCRDLLVAQAGGQVGFHDETFGQLAQEMSAQTLFDTIALITRYVPEIKGGLQPKVYAEMLTIALSQPDNQTPPQLPADLTQQLQALQNEITQLKDDFARLGASPASTQSAKPVKNTYTYKVDRNKVMRIMQTTVADSQQSKAYLDALQDTWNEILDSLSAPDRALLLGSRPVLASQDYVILAFDYSFNAEQTMKRPNLNDVFGNILSKVADFSPEIIALGQEDFDSIKEEFRQSRMSPKEKEAQARQDIPDGFDFLDAKMERFED
ncbi:DNA polymerase III subunit gamma/tau [Streptococcus sp. DD12]|uniref:DNA polymerase III subunit gamma/tau n=1 Tax=Streptococcus sp. DD12 TaxID=1777880 RepID=UPI000798EA7A|nr:DNA polymerase III subunit gamma/tau [Streptococcus sp. DD12]KXT76168.1 DNA polymerase III subunits gamma and tau [Streptococcus sp. DD12]